MKKAVIAAVAIVIIVGLIGINTWADFSRSSLVVDLTNLKKETVTETTMISGTLHFASHQTIEYVPERGEVEELYVKEGEEVEEGSPLFRYKNSQLTFDKRQNELELRAANLQLNDLIHQHNAIDEKLAEDEENEALQEEHDSIELQHQQANIKVEQVLLQKESIEQQLAELEVKSDITGTVIAIKEPKASGTQQPFIQIGSPNELIVEGFLSEYDVLKIEEGQPVTLTSEAAHDKSWEGTVRYISQLPEEESGKETVQYPVQMTVDDPEIDLRPGSQLIAEIVTDEYTAMTLPITAVKQDEDTPYVYVVNDTVAEKREVTTGSSVNQSIVITEGLTKEDEVIVNPGENVMDGMEVMTK